MSVIGRKHTKEEIEKMRTAWSIRRANGFTIWNKGIKTGPNPEHSERMKGKPSWNKGLCGEKSHWYGKKRNPISVKKSALKRRGVPRPNTCGANNPMWKVDW